RWNIRRRTRARKARYAQRTQAAGTNMRQRAGQRAEIHVDLAADQIDQRRAAAFVRHLDEIDFRLTAKKLSGQVGRAAGAGGCTRQLPGLVARECDQLSDTAGGQSRVY